MQREEINLTDLTLESSKKKEKIREYTSQPGF